MRHLKTIELDETGVDIVPLNLFTKLSILSHTHGSFAQAVESLLGKGAHHAGLIYQELIRYGKIQGKDPSFGNAQGLLHEILDRIDFTLPEVTKLVEDGSTKKFLIKTHDALEIESVIIPMKAGSTLCVSSQVGCKMGCTFCETGRMGLLRNLTTEEIISQVFIAKHTLGCQVRNIVFMGMGEPFDNYDNVMQAVRILNDPKGFGFGRNHITISTSGLVDGIDRLILEGAHAPNLALSINAPTDALRNKLMPVNRRYNMEQLHQAMERFHEATGREILVAYVLLRDVNDSLIHAEQLAQYLQGLKIKINLIPYNAQSKDRFASPDPAIVSQFAKYLQEKGFYTLVRGTKGSPIMAACGQLGNINRRKRIGQTAIIN